MTKQERYDALVKNVAACNTCDKCTACNSGETIVLKHHDTRKQINLWSHWQGSLKADILLLGQDWGALDASEVERIENALPYPSVSDAADDRKYHNHTDSKISGLFSKELGIDVKQATERCFFANAILCYKTGNLSGPIRSKWQKNCEQYINELILIVQPKAIITLGQAPLGTLRGIGMLTDQNGIELKKDYFNSFIGNVIFTKKEKALCLSLKTPDADPFACTVFPMIHPSPLALRYRKEEEQTNDWKEIGNFLKVLPH